MTTALTAPQQSVPTVQADEQQLHALKASLDDAIAAADATLGLCRQMCGPELHGEIGKAFTMLNQGTGFMRTVRDGLASLFRQRNVLRREAAEQAQAEPPQGSPECRTGASIWMTHAFGRGDKCVRCGYKMPWKLI